MDTEIRELLQLQSGVIARHQALAVGMAEHDIRRKLRRREWATVHPGVYVNHTGPLPFLQRAGLRSCARGRLCCATRPRSGSETVPAGVTGMTRSSTSPSTGTGRSA